MAKFRRGRYKEPDLGKLGIPAPPEKPPTYSGKATPIQSLMYGRSYTPLKGVPTTPVGKSPPESAVASMYERAAGFQEGSVGQRVTRRGGSLAKRATVGEIFLEAAPKAEPGTLTGIGLGRIRPKGTGSYMSYLDPKKAAERMLPIIEKNPNLYPSYVKEGAKALAEGKWPKNLDKIKKWAFRGGKFRGGPKFGGTIAVWFVLPFVMEKIFGLLGVDPGKDDMKKLMLKLQQAQMPSAEDMVTQSKIQLLAGAMQSGQPVQIPAAQQMMGAM